MPHKEGRFFMYPGGFAYMFIVALGDEHVLTGAALFYCCLQ